MTRCHRSAVTLVGVFLACSSGRARSGDAEARQAVVAAMEHYTALIRVVASDSIAAMYADDGELLEAGMAPLRGPKEIRAFLAQFDGKVVVDSASTVSDAHSPAAAASAVVRPVTHRGDHRSSTRGSNRLHDG